MNNEAHLLQLPKNHHSVFYTNFLDADSYIRMFKLSNINDIQVIHF